MLLRSGYVCIMKRYELKLGEGGKGGGGWVGVGGLREEEEEEEEILSL